MSSSRQIDLIKAISPDDLFSNFNSFNTFEYNPKLNFSDLKSQEPSKEDLKINLMDIFDMVEQQCSTGIGQTSEESLSLYTEKKKYLDIEEQKISTTASRRISNGNRSIHNMSEKDFIGCSLRTINQQNDNDIGKKRKYNPIPSVDNSVVFFEGKKNEGSVIPESSKFVQIPKTMVQRGSIEFSKKSKFKISTNKFNSKKRVYENEVEEDEDIDMQNRVLESIDFDDIRRKKSYEELLNEELIRRRQQQEEQNQRQKYASMKITRKDPTKANIGGLAMGNTNSMFQRNLQKQTTELSTQASSNNYKIKPNPKKPSLQNQTTYNFQNINSERDTDFFKSLNEEDLRKIQMLNNSKLTLNQNNSKISLDKKTTVYPIISQQNANKKQKSNYNDFFAKNRPKNDMFIAIEENNSNQYKVRGNKGSKQKINFNEVNVKVSNNKGMIYDLKKEQYGRNWNQGDITKNNGFIDMMDKNGK